MAKSKQIPDGAMSSDEMAVTAVPDERNSQHEAEETPKVEAADTHPNTQVVVCAYEGTEEEIQAIWEKQYGKEGVSVMPVPVGYSVRTALTDCIAMSNIADHFVFVPANTIPCIAMTFSELCFPTVYVAKNGAEQYDFRLPRSFCKSDLVEYLSEVDEADDEAFLRGYVQRFVKRPMQVGFSFGNYVTPVLRGTPCEHVVMEGLVRKRFLSASPEGWAAISQMVTQALLK